MQDTRKLLAYFDTLDMPVATTPLPPFRKGETEGVGEREGFFYLHDREYLVPLYRERTRIAKRKWRKMRRIAWWMRFVPFLRIVFASGSLTFDNTDELSDLDVVIVAKHGHIWTTRLLVSGLLWFLRALRTHEDMVAPDKVCPNHFITDQSLHIPFHSMYTAQLYSHLVPLIVYEQDDIKKFRDANAWVLKFVPEWYMHEDRVVRQGLSFGIQWIGEMLIGLLGDRVEMWARKYQKRRIEAKSNLIKPGGHLVYNDNMLAFHLGSSEAEILKKYEENLTKSMRG